MLGNEVRADDTAYVVEDPDGVQVKLTGPHPTFVGRVGFVLSVTSRPSSSPSYYDRLFAGDQDDALELANQILHHAGFKNVEITASRELHEASDAS